MPVTTPPNHTPIPPFDAGPLWGLVCVLGDIAIRVVQQAEEDEATPNAVDEDESRA